MLIHNKIAGFLNARLALLFAAGLFTGNSLAETRIDIDPRRPEAPLRRVIGFYGGCPIQDSLFTALAPTHADCPGDAHAVDAQPVCTGCFWGTLDSSSIGSIAQSYCNDNSLHLEFWTEPNRTFTGNNEPDQNAWLEGTDWNAYLHELARMYRAARKGCPHARIHLPNISTDHEKDPRWISKITDFLDAWVDSGFNVDYISVNIPYRPEDVQIVSSIAHNYAMQYPSLGIQGVSIGEYPFFRNEPSLHLRFFLAFEKAANVAYALKSNYRATPYNSGLIDADGKPLPVYWLYRAYSRMSGSRVYASRGGATGRVVALASYDSTCGALRALVGNDEDDAETISLAIKPIRQIVSIRVMRIAAEGLIEEDVETPLTADSLISVDLGAIVAGDARFLIVEFAPAALAFSRPAIVSTKRTHAVEEIWDIRGRKLSTKAVQNGPCRILISANQKSVWLR